MSILNSIEIGKKLPIHSDYGKQVTKIDYWRRTFDSDVDYIRGSDARGNPIVPKHMCEHNKDYEQRLSLTKSKNYAGSIVSQYNSFLYNSEVTREGLPEELQQNADLYGNSWSRIMQDASLDAQVAGRHYFMPNTNAPSEQLSVAQKVQRNIRGFVDSISRESVVNWSRENDSLTEAIILFEDFARYVNDEVIIDFAITKNNRNSIIVGEVIDEVAHGYGEIPLIEVYPRLWKDSQIAKLAELQQTVINLESVLMVELMNHTFTHWVLAGDFDPDQMGNITFGQGKVTVLSTQGSTTVPSLNRLGSETSQADSLRMSIKENIAEIYRTAGLSAPDPIATSSPESGISKLVSFSNTNSIVRSIADAMEEAENKLLQLLGLNATVSYPDDFSNLVDANNNEV